MKAGVGQFEYLQFAWETFPDTHDPRETRGRFICHILTALSIILLPMPDRIVFHLARNFPFIPCYARVRSDSHESAAPT